MKTRLLGHTGVEVSALCLGTMYFGSRENAEISYQLLDQYVEAGGTFLDTANIYVRWIPGFVGGESETLLGRWMKERGNSWPISLPPREDCSDCEDAFQTSSSITQGLRISSRLKNLMASSSSTCWVWGSTFSVLPPAR